MTENQMALIEDLQAEGLQECREMLYKTVFETDFPHSHLPEIERCVEYAYRTGIETEADILTALLNEEEDVEQ